MANGSFLFTTQYRRRPLRKHVGHQYAGFHICCRDCSCDIKIGRGVWSIPYHLVNFFV